MAALGEIARAACRQRPSRTELARVGGTLGQLETGSQAGTSVSPAAICPAYLALLNHLRSSTTSVRGAHSPHPAGSLRIKAPQPLSRASYPCSGRRNCIASVDSGLGWISGNGSLEREQGGLGSCKSSPCAYRSAARSVASDHQRGLFSSCAHGFPRTSYSIKISNDPLSAGWVAAPEASIETTNWRATNRAPGTERLMQ